MHPTTPPAVLLATPSLGNRSYLVHDGSEALVVDPPRDVERVEAAAEATGLRIAAVAETHVHNDHVSGGRRLARRHGADHLLAAAEEVRFDRVGCATATRPRAGSWSRGSAPPATPRATSPYLVGVLMGCGARIAYGCNIGRLLRGHRVVQPARLAVGPDRARRDRHRGAAAAGVRPHQPQADGLGVLNA